MLKNETKYLGKETRLEGEEVGASDDEAVAAAVAAAAGRLIEGLRHAAGVVVQQPPVQHQLDLAGSQGRTGCRRRLHTVTAGRAGSQR